MGKPVLWEPFLGAGWSTCKALGTRSPLNRYPGSKRFKKYALLHQPARMSFASDSDQSVLAVWRAWLDRDVQLMRQMREWKSRFAFDANEAWEDLKSAWEDCSGVELAAASLAIRFLTFGSILRRGAGGQLNIAMSAGQLAKLPNWQWNLPDRPSGPVHLSSDWRHSFALLKAAQPDEAIAVIDPPYWLPYEPGTARRGTGAIGPSYPNHEPHAETTLKLCLEAAKAAAGKPCFTRICITNYYSPELDEALQAIAPFRLEMGGRLDGINAGKRKGTNHVEGMWVLERPKVSTVVETVLRGSAIARGVASRNTDALGRGRGDGRRGGVRTVTVRRKRKDGRTWTGQQHQLQWQADGVKHSRYLRKAIAPKVRADWEAGATVKELLEKYKLVEPKNA